MAITASCPRCGYRLEAANEDELVSAVRQHVRNDHGLDHELPRKHVLAMLRKQRPADTGEADG